MQAHKRSYSTICHLKGHCTASAALHYLCIETPCILFQRNHMPIRLNITHMISQMDGPKPFVSQIKLHRFPRISKPIYYWAAQIHIFSVLIILCKTIIKIKRQFRRNFRSFFSFVLINKNGSTTTTITGLGSTLHWNTFEVAFESVISNKKNQI